MTNWHKNKHETAQKAPWQAIADDNASEVQTPTISEELHFSVYRFEHGVVEKNLLHDYVTEKFNHGSMASTQLEDHIKSGIPEPKGMLSYGQLVQMGNEVLVKTIDKINESLDTLGDSKPDKSSIASVFESARQVLIAEVHQNAAKQLFDQQFGQNKSEWQKIVDEQIKLMDPKIAENVLKSSPNLD